MPVSRTRGVPGVGKREAVAAAVRSSATGPLTAPLPPLTAHRPSCRCSFLYDARGSQLYEHITKLDEYYPYE